MTSRMKNWALWGTGLGTAALIAAGALYPNLPRGAKAASETTATAPAPTPAIPVTVASVAPKTVTLWQEFSGRLEAIERVQIRSRVAGAVQSTHFREGGLVKAGDLLVTIDPAPYAAEAAQAEGQVASAQARVDLAWTELERGRNLSARNTISQSELAQRESAHREALAALQSANAQLRAAQLNLDYTQIRAPISGRVGKIEINVGNLVAAGSASTPLTTLISADPIYASFDASEELMGGILADLPVENGMPAIQKVPVEIGTLADEGTPIKGKLQLIDNEVNSATGTIRLRAVFDNPDGRLLPGQFVRVRMGQPKATDELVISERAIGTDQDKKFVLVVDDANTVQYRQIALGAAIDGQRVVESGLSAGERIVVNGLQRVRPGVVVAPQTEGQVAQQ